MPDCSALALLLETSVHPAEASPYLPLLQTLGFVMGTVAMGLGFAIAGEWETSSYGALSLVVRASRPVWISCSGAAWAELLQSGAASVLCHPPPSLTASLLPHLPARPADNMIHRNLGVACTVLGFTQFSALIFRPAPGEKYRFAWEQWHHWVGRSVSPCQRCLAGLLGKRALGVMGGACLLSSMSYHALCVPSILCHLLLMSSPTALPPRPTGDGAGNCQHLLGLHPHVEPGRLGLGLLHCRAGGHRGRRGGQGSAQLAPVGLLGSCQAMALGDGVWACQDRVCTAHGGAYLRVWGGCRCVREMTAHAL